MKLSELSVLSFTDRVASVDPAPGGGSAAALYGALGAALTAMVGGMTQGRKKYAEYAERAKELEDQCLAFKDRLSGLMDSDTEAFLLVSNAYAMPKETDEEKKKRSAAIQEGLAACTRTPLSVMDCALEALECAAAMAEGFNVNCASDLGVAVLSLKAAVQGAWLNVLINIGSLKDREYAEEARKHGAETLERAVSLADSLYGKILGMVENG